MSGPVFWAGMRLAQWVANQFGGGSSGRGGGGGSDEPGVIYGTVAEGSKFEWLAVHVDYLQTFRREVYGNSRLVTFESFINTLTESMKRDRSVRSYCQTVFDNLDAVCSRYPDRLMFIWDGR